MPGDTAERIRRLQERRVRTGSPTAARPQPQSAPPPTVSWPPPGDVVTGTLPTGVAAATVATPDRRQRRRRRQPAIITRSLLGVASIGTFLLLVIAMGPAQPSTDPGRVDDATVLTTTAPPVTVLTVGDIGQLSASLHQGSAPAAPSTTGR